MKTHLATALAATVLATSAMAQLPYQGRLTDSTGAPINPPSGTKSIRFELYGAATGGSPLWGPQDIVVNIVDGRFATKLGVGGAGGDITAALQGGATFLQMTVDTVNLTRQEILPTPTAMFAEASERISTPNTRLAEISSGTSGSFRNAQNYSFGSSGVLFETQLGDQSGGFFLEDDGAILYNTGSSNYLQVLDYDEMLAGSTPSSKFTIGSNGSITTAGNSTTAGNLNVGNGFFFVDSSSGNVGINQRFSTVTFNVRGNSHDDLYLNVVNSAGNAGIFRVLENSVEAYRNTSISGSENNGSVAALNVNGMLIDANEIDSSSGRVYINNNKGTSAGGLDIYSGSSSIATNDSPTVLTMRAKSSTRATQTWNMRIQSGDVGDAELYFSYNGAQMGYLESDGSGWKDGSDRRLKQDIQPMESVLDRALQLKPVTYNLISTPNVRKQIGLIAQEVEELFPETVSDVDPEEEMLALSYPRFGVIAIGALQELHQELETEKTKNAALENRLAALEEQLSNVVNTVATLQSEPEKELSQVD